MALLETDTALVTGASSGIGATVVDALRNKGLVVHAIARRGDRLEALAEATGCEIHVLDVRQRDAFMALAASVEADVLVNNAGLGRGFGLLAEADPDDVAQTLDTNVQAAVHAVQAVLPGMIERGRGHVINLGSMAGLYPLSSAVYGASKGAMHFLSLNLRLELQGTGIRVTEICPGRVDTEFYKVAIEDDATRDRFLDTDTSNLTAGDVSDAIMYALETPWHVNINRIELQATEQTYGGSQFVKRRTDEPRL